MSPFSDLFASPQPRILTDDDVESAVLELVRAANERLVLISPYNQYWFHLKKALEEAIIGRGVKVAVGYRTKDASYRSKEGIEDVAWLAKLGATVVAVANLHAKIYMNESTALVASMNLTEWSTKNSREICVRIEGRERSKLDDYVKDLMNGGTPLASATPGRGSHAPSRASATPSRGSHASSRASAAPSRAHATRGWCIRCKADIPFDDERPLCHKDFLSWNQYKDPNYEERYCHRCGQVKKTTFAKPLCDPCYKAS